MTELPVSFVVSFVFVIVLVRYSAFAERRIGLFPSAALALLALQSTLLGLHWNYNVHIMWPIQGLIATLIPPLTWFALTSLVSREQWQVTMSTCLQLLLPPLLVVVATLITPNAVDVVIAAVFIGYGNILLYTSFKEDFEWLDRVPFQALLSTKATFRVAGATLIASALVDIAVSYDIQTARGSLAPAIVGVSSLAIILILGASIAVVGSLTKAVQPLGPGVVLPTGPPGGDPQTTEECQALHAESIKRLDSLMISKRFYRDPNLTLDRLARRLTVPTRVISGAVNTQRAMNVPQYVNMFRIMESCQLLRSNSVQITDMIFDVGFQTKSNFNREFHRVIGMSPSEWRQSNVEITKLANANAFIIGLQGSIDNCELPTLFPSAIVRQRHA